MEENLRQERLLREQRDREQEQERVRKAGREQRLRERIRAEVSVEMRQQVDAEVERLVQQRRAAWKMPRVLRFQSCCRFWAS